MFGPGSRDRGRCVCWMTGLVAAVSLLAAGALHGQTVLPQALFDELRVKSLSHPARSWCEERGSGRAI